MTLRQGTPLIVNALSIDVEEYYHGMEFEAALSPAERQRLPSRVELGLNRVLDLLAAQDIRATFFVVGVVAEAHPRLVRRLVAAGHEVGCHSYRHELVSRQSRDEFRADARHAKATLENITGEPVLGYRAPNFSIARSAGWAFDILLEEGFRYDSSIYPIVHDRYGDPRAPRFPYAIRRNGDTCLIEFPIGTVPLFGVNLPIGGGGYFRLFPADLIRRGIARVNSREQQPTMFYFHPWELDPEQPRSFMPWTHRFRHYVGLSRMKAKLDHLLRAIRFTTAREVLGARGLMADTVDPTASRPKLSPIR